MITQSANKNKQKLLLAPGQNNLSKKSGLIYQPSQTLHINHYI